MMVLICAVVRDGAWIQVGQSSATDWYSATE